VVDLFPAVAATSATPGGALAAKARMVAQLNFLLLKLNTGEVDACRLMCQQYLRSTPTMAELWIVYAWIEEVAGNHSDAELILNKFVLRYSDQFAGWHAYALFALVRKSPAAALDVLARSVGQFLTPGPEGAKELALPLATVRSVFHALLHLPAPEGQAPLRLAATSGTTGRPRVSLLSSSLLPPLLWYCLVFSFRLLCSCVCACVRVCVCACVVAAQQ
jgi:hypothetical protein